MRFSVLSALVLATVSMVTATPVENSLELSSSHLLARDVDTVEGKLFEEQSGLEERACASTWYLTKCNYYCPCGWYYYPQNHCANKRCYDTKRVGCRGKCPKASLRCGTCK
ncbi:hypothetical protein [Absidia glauca]|uniref:Uncharacterized protein n=1 Tax=Absidia glauca TaxID=4829 RepID=A0A163TBC1_ABSGL|nr:hypothetical protein [Absidia glauca]